MLVKELIARLRKSGEIEPDDLVYLDQSTSATARRIASANEFNAA